MEEEHDDRDGRLELEDRKERLFETVEEKREKPKVDALGLLKAGPAKARPPDAASFLKAGPAKARPPDPPLTVKANADDAGW